MFLHNTKPETVNSNLSNPANARPPHFDDPAKRIAWLRMKHDLTLEEFGHKCAYHGSHISRIEKGLVRPGRRFVLMVCEAFNVREEWLMEGEMPVYHPTPEPVSQDLDNGDDIVDSLLRTVKHVATLPPGGRRLAAHALHEMVDDLCNPKAPESAPANEPAPEPAAEDPSPESE
jgi:transcriptional regulator with XRE-family HTH domain